MQEFSPIVDCWYLTGATATGKSQIGLSLAQRIDAEIVSLDSMAVYQGMDIGTAKPSRDDRKAVPHHLLDLVSPAESFSLSEYLSAAHQVVSDLRKGNKKVLFVGGTPLYLKALLRGVCEGPPADEDFRREVEAEVDRIGLAALRQRLEQVDPLSATKLHPNDKRRMIRALEVYKITGVPISHYQTQFEEQSSQRCPSVFVLSRERGALHQRINQRVDNMFERGFVGEVQGILDRYGQFSQTAIQGVGYREVLHHLNGKMDLDPTIEQTKARTRKFARRQETGFGDCRNASGWI